MRVAIVFDCIYPYTVGGAERWYVDLANRFSEDRDVTYIASHHWPKGEHPDVPYELIAVSRGEQLYTESGRRKLGPPIRFATGLFFHLLRHGKRYDVVHSASAPILSIMAIRLAQLLRRHGKLVVDWHEVWDEDYWIEYLGPVLGRVGYRVQMFCTRMSHHNFTDSHMHARRLQRSRDGESPTRLTGLFVERERPEQRQPAATPPIVVFAGRHIPEKGVVALPAAVVEARKRIPGLRCEIFGDGPERVRVQAEIDRLGAGDYIEAPGFVAGERLRTAMTSAACFALPSTREGYGLVVVDSQSRGVPVVVVDGPDNAAIELVTDGLDGFVSESVEPAPLGAAIAKAIEAGEPLRESTWDSYERRRSDLLLDNSFEKIAAVYAHLTA